MPIVIARAEDLKSSPRHAEVMPHPKNVLMIRPTYFNIDTAINPHMRKADGSAHELDTSKAMTQWENLKAQYEKIGFRVVALEGVAGLPDMCFSANQSLPFLDARGNKRALLSNMATDTRHIEVDHVAAALVKEGYSCESVDARRKETFFEGMGDCLWLPGRRFLIGGYGHRTTAAMYSKIAERTGADVAIFNLKNPRFYHLDTCLSILNETTVLACRDAFNDEGWALLNAIFTHIIEVPLAEADSPQFACNAHCPDGKHVFIQPGSIRTNSAMTQAGFKVVEVDTSEFIKSGGSVFCLKLMFF